MPLRIGITLGDPAGIGPEIIRGALTSEKLPRDVDCKVIGDVGIAVAGTPTADSARVALAAMEEAVVLAISGEVDAIATGPIHKARMAEIGFAFPGQTEFFAARSGTINYAMISMLVPLSRFPVGSSARITSGLLIRARAMATRCC